MRHINKKNLKAEVWNYKTSEVKGSVEIFFCVAPAAEKNTTDIDERIRSRKKIKKGLARAHLPDQTLIIFFNINLNKHLEYTF